MSYNWSDIVRKIKMKCFASKEIWTVFGKNISWSPLPHYPNCQVFDLTKYWNLANNSAQYVKFYFYKKPNVSVSLFVEDKNRALAKRSLKSQITSQEGTQMLIQNLNQKNQYRRFYLSLSQTRNLEMDPGVSCKNYPTKEFSNYQDCDESFVYNLMNNDYKIMPFWAARKLDEVTRSGYDVVTNKHFKNSCELLRLNWF